MWSGGDVKATTTGSARCGGSGGYCQNVTDLPICPKEAEDPHYVFVDTKGPVFAAGFYRTPNEAPVDKLYFPTVEQINSLMRDGIPLGVNPTNGEVVYLPVTSKFPGGLCRGQNALEGVYPVFAHKGIRSSFWTRLGSWWDNALGLMAKYHIPLSLLGMGLVIYYFRKNANIAERSLRINEEMKDKLFSGRFGPSPDEVFNNNLTEKARAGMYPDYAFDFRMYELRRMAEALESGKSVVAVGEHGTGKSAATDMLVVGSSRGMFPGLENAEFRDGSTLHLIADAGIVGTLEGRIRYMIEETKKAKQKGIRLIWVSPELHSLLALSISGGGISRESERAVNLMKDAMTEGNLQLLGNATMQEYLKMKARDPAFDDRFVKVEILPATISETLEAASRGMGGMLRKVHEDLRASAMAQGLSEKVAKVKIVLPEESVRALIVYADEFGEGNLPRKGLELIKLFLTNAKNRIIKMAKAGEAVPEEIILTRADVHAFCEDYYQQSLPPPDEVERLAKMDVSRVPRGYESEAERIAREQGREFKPRSGAKQVMRGSLAPVIAEGPLFDYLIPTFARAMDVSVADVRQLLLENPNLAREYMGVIRECEEVWRTMPAEDRARFLAEGGQPDFGRFILENLRPGGTSTSGSRAGITEDVFGRARQVLAEFKKASELARRASKK